MKWLIVVLLVALPVSAQEARKLVDAARKQIGVTVRYDPAYTSLPYPDGDVPREKGVCTDVVIRAMRDGLSMDLQKLVHEDMKSNFSSYPKNWNLRKPDSNIDHRRVLNLRKFFQRQSFEIRLPAKPDAAFFRPGDLVTCTVPPNLPHIMIVSDRAAADGTPLVIHNIGGGTKEEDRLRVFELTGLYRLKEKP